MTHCESDMLCQSSKFPVFPYFEAKLNIIVVQTFQKHTQKQTNKQTGHNIIIH